MLPLTRLQAHTDQEEDEEEEEGAGEAVHDGGGGGDRDLDHSLVTMPPFSGELQIF